jgi:hypothetical protein
MGELKITGKHREITFEMDADGDVYVEVEFNRSGDDNGEAFYLFKADIEKLRAWLDESKERP